MDNATIASRLQPVVSGLNNLIADLLHDEGDLVAPVSQTTIPYDTAAERDAIIESPLDAIAHVEHMQEEGAPPPKVTSRLIPWGATVSRDFLMSVLWIEEQIGLKVECIMPCMKFESNINPAAKNPYSSGSGLIQFMESTARRLGTTTAALRAMDAVSQLTYVYKYFKEYKDRGFKLHLWSVEDTYMAILWPAAIGKPPEYRVFVDDPAKQRDAYDVNKGLDLDKDGFVTKREAAAKVTKLYKQGLESPNVGYL